MTLLEISGVAMPTPEKYNVSLSDVDADTSGRSETGYMHRDRVRSDVAKIELSWGGITTRQLETITAAIAAPSFPVKYFYGETRTATMYAGDRKVELLAMHTDGTGAVWNLSFNLVEL